MSFQNEQFFYDIFSCIRFSTNKTGKPLVIVLSLFNKNQEFVNQFFLNLWLRKILPGGKSTE
jgi:hypothetical protein